MIWTGAEEEEQARSSGRQKQEKKMEGSRQCSFEGGAAKVFQ